MQKSASGNIAKAVLCNRCKGVMRVSFGWLVAAPAVNFISVLREHFSYKILAPKFKKLKHN